MAPSAPAEPTEAEKRFQVFFTALAQKDYAKQTGNTTRSILSQVLNDYPLGINSYSVIHDNACGPGTATELLVEWTESRDMLPSAIVATDSTPAMIDALNATKAARSRSWREVTPHVMDSHYLTLPDDHFTLIFCNFSIFTFNDPIRCLRQIHRTQKHAGTAIITCWKRFGIIEVINAAQKAIKPDAKLLPVAGPQFSKEGYLAMLVERAGWEKGKIKTVSKKEVVKEGPELDNLIDFMTGDFVAPAHEGWTDEEKAKWPAAIKDAVEEEKKQHGGILMEAWVVLARKWFIMSA